MKTRGFTIVEVMIASTILAICMGVALTFLGKMADSMETDIQFKDLQLTTQYMLDALTTDLKESKPSMVSIFDREEVNPDHTDDGNLWQTAVCFPTARNKAGEFQYMDEDGVVQEEPVWQGIVVYFIDQGHLVRYIDYTATFTDSTWPQISSINGTTITLTDGTTFTRSLTSGDHGNQTVKRMRKIKQMLRFPFDSSDTDKVVFPLAMQVTTEGSFFQLKGGEISTDNHTSIIARNRN